MEYPTWIFKERERHVDGHLYLTLSENRIEDRKFLYDKLKTENLEFIDEIISYFRDKYAISRWHGLSKAKRRKIFIENKATCMHCGANLTRETFTVEHVIPFCLGGTNDEENLRIACGPCNQEYTRSLDTLITKLMNEDQKEKEKYPEKNNV